MSISVKLAGESVPPLVVDLDGTLIRTDLLVESFFAYLGAEPLRILSLATALRGEKLSSRPKSHVASTSILSTCPTMSGCCRSFAIRVTMGDGFF